MGNNEVLAIAALPTLLDELDEDPADLEHPDVAVTAPDGEWTISASSSGRVTWENIEDGGPRHMIGLGRPEILLLFTAVARGDLDSVESQPWQPGYSN